MTDKGKLRFLGFEFSGPPIICKTTFKPAIQATNPASIVFVGVVDDYEIARFVNLEFVAKIMAHLVAPTRDQAPFWKAVWLAPRQADVL